MKNLRFYILFPLLMVISRGEEERLDLKSAIAELKDDAYEVRERASQFLWMNADVEELEAFKDDEEPEVRHRVREVLRHIHSGIRPDTSEDVKALVEEFYEADPRRKVVIIEELNKLKAYVPIFSLFRNEDDEKLKEIMKVKVAPILNDALAHHLKKEELSTALSLLDTMGGEVKYARMWAAMVRDYGDEKKELKEVSEISERSEDEGVKYLALLRAVGKVKEAEELAETIGQDSYLASRAFLKGDFMNYLKWWKKEFKSVGISEDFLRPFELRLEGKWNEVEDYYPVLIDGAGKGKRAKQRAIFHLIALGKCEAAFSLASKEEKLFMSDYLTSRDRYEELFALFGVKLGDLPSDEWVKKHIDNEDGEWWFSSSLKNLDKLGEAYAILEGNSSVEEMLSPIWDKVKGNKDDAYEFLATLSNSGQGQYMRFALKLAEEKIEGNEARYRRLFLSGEDINNYLWDLSEELLPELSFMERVSTIRACTVSYSIDGEREMAYLNTLLSALREDCIENPDDEKKERYLAGLYKHLGYQELYLQFEQQRYRKDPSPENKNALISQLVFLDKWDEAAEVALTLDRSEIENMPDLGVYQASVLYRGGEAEEGERILSEYLKKALDAPHPIFTSSGLFMENGVHKEAESILKKGLAVVNPDELEGTYWMRFLERGAKIYEKEGDYKLSAMCGEALILHYVKRLYQSRSSLVGAGGAGSLNRLAAQRYTTDLMWAKHFALTEKNDKRAKPLVGELVNEWKGHGTLADDLYLFLREASYDELLKESLEGSVAQIEKTLAFYPDAENLKNTVAWLCSRAVMQLPKAQRYIEEARSESPRSAPYLDTSAEVYFAQGDREKALEFSKRAWQDAVTSHMYSESVKMIKDQYYYFRDSPLPTAKKD